MPGVPLTQVPSIGRAVEVAAPRVSSPRVAAIIVTWNRHAALDVVLKALSRQNFPIENLDIVIVDNASTDDTSGFVTRQWQPDAIVDNPTHEAHEPRFAASKSARNGRASDGFRSLTLIRNAVNHGGCGGFNTGLAYLAEHLDSEDQPLDYAWLVDDDVDLPEGALSQLTSTAEADRSVGLVGSRTVDFADRRTTIETTIYFDFDNGWMGPEPVPGHRLFDSHRRWAESIGGTRGDLKFSGLREVDVVSACSMLARWSAVKEVGFWDKRYFIYCDDADWCLRFAMAGHRVVLDLDAVVYHTHWLAKLTPARAYYSQRNLIWLTQKVLTGKSLKKATLRRLGNLLLDSRKAMMHCRLFHAEIIRRTAHDIVTNRGGKLDNEGPAFIPLMDALSDALGEDKTIIVMCSHPDAPPWADDLRTRITKELAASGKRGPKWIYLTKSGLPGPADQGAEAIWFESNRASKWNAQKRFLLHPPAATLILEQSNDFPLLRSRCNIHIDRRRVGLAQREQDGLVRRAAFLVKWMWTGVRCVAHSLLVQRHTPRGRYG